MAKVMDLVIKKMYSAYANQLVDYQSQYYCNNCEQQFSANWNLRANAFNPYVNRGNTVLCPYCGERHDKNIKFLKQGEHAPYNVKLSLSTFKNKVVLSVAYKAFCFTDLYKFNESKGKETFTFNIENEQSNFLKKVQIGSHEPEFLTLPIELLFKDEILSNSILQYFYHKSVATSDNRADLIEILRLLREEIAGKLAVKYKNKISSIYINALGSDYGMFLLPFINMANRIKVPKAENIDVHYKMKKPVMMPSIPKWSGIANDWSNKYKEKLQEGKDKITAIIEAVGLPNKDAVRKLIDTDINNIASLKLTFSLCSNYDLAIRFSQAFKNIKKDIAKPKLISFLKEMLKVYTEQDLIQFLDKAIEYNLEDCLQLHEKLTEENKIKLIEKRIRLRELHDWMAIEHKKQNHVNMELNVPEHIINRLTMQKDRLTFFLPKESMELLRVGHSLNNCVLTYSERMEQGKQLIVIGTDDKGRYTTCLRVMDNKLVEAKINRNKTVSSDPVINKAVIEWANQAKLTIDTKDVKVIQESLIKTA